MRLASPLHWALIAVGVASLAGCATTQQKAARLRLNDARVLASEQPVHVRGHDPRVRVLGTTLVRGQSGSALIVRIRNVGKAPVSDLAITVGVSERHRLLYLNTAAGLGYFQTHIPAISPGAVLTWVFTTARRLSPRSHPFAAVGPSTVPPLHIPRTLPVLAAHLSPQLEAFRGGALQIAIKNLSALPQYQLPVYAIASRGGRYVAAGQAVVSQLDGGAVATLELRLTGDANRAAVSVQTSPTIFG